MSNVVAATTSPSTPHNANSESARIWSAFALAVAAGALALASPPLALGALALLGVRAIARSSTPRINLASCLGPAIAAFVVGAFVGLAGAIGVIFVWRVFADAKWSLAAARTPAREPRAPLLDAQAWLTPFFGVCVVAYTAPHMVAGLPLDLPHVPFWVPLGVGVLALASVLDWALRRAVDWRLGELARAPAEHMLSHHLLFVLALGVGLDVSAGIVALVAWRLASAATPQPQASFTAVP